MDRVNSEQSEGLQKDVPYDVVMVDDSSTTITILSKILKKHQILVTCYTDPHLFLKELPTLKVDLFLFDVMMPGINGMELCRIVKKEDAFKDIPVIFITGQSNTGSVIKGFEAGAVDYIKKPFDSHELLARVKTHLELRRSKEQLRTMNAAKDRFLSIIAHDIRNPLTYIIGVTSLFLTRDEPEEWEEIEEAMRNIYDSSGDVLNMLNNVLHWAKSQMGGISVHKEDINFYDIAERALAQIKNNADSKDIPMENHLDKTLELYADKTMMVIVLRNLLSNAVKFSRAGCKISIIASLESGEYVIGVKDRGCGISEENINKLFKVDTHFTTRGTNRESGSGLGLLLCKELIEKQDGKLWIKSTVDRGTTVYFKVPGRIEGGECE